jgi:hypothetical protein
MDENTKIWGVVYFVVQNPQMFCIKQIVAIVPTTMRDTDRVYREFVASSWNTQPLRQVDWWLREPPFPWEEGKQLL